MPHLPHKTSVPSVPDVLQDLLVSCCFHMRVSACMYTDEVNDVVRSKLLSTNDSIISMALFCASLCRFPWLHEKFGFVVVF